MLGVTSCTPKESKVEPYQPYKPFAIIVDETHWDGELEPGRYTKNGVKILEKHER